MNATQSVLTKNQKKSWTKEYTEGGETFRIVATARYDDQCGNGHNSFVITADIDRKSKNGRWVADSGGCVHEDIAKRFPKLAPLIKWHLTGSDGPMHYIASTVFHASDLDCWGGLKGEPKTTEYYVRPDGSGLLIAWPETDGEYRRPKPQRFETREEAQAVADAHGNAVVKEWVLSRHEGKERQLDYARSTAVWPEATDAELTEPGLKERLEARLPAIMVEFRAAVESLGFTF